jgi:thioesterase domain-containing protein/acyl carrier protein
VPIGRPIANTQIYLLDRHQQPMPVGVPGEVHIGGVGLARGYLNRSDLTAERFIPHPFSDEPGARLYKTGDLARYLPDGNLEFLGRLDSQVKIRGFRIEVGEIEAVLRQHPAVSQAIVVAWGDGPGDTRLVAYVVPNQERASTTHELRTFLREKLPDYMVPSAYVMLDALPLNPSGKVDRLALPVPDKARPELEGTFVAPRTPLEFTIAEIWQDVLGMDRMSVYDNFFDLGGHSLLAVRLFAQIEKTFGKRLPLAVLFEAPTIEQLTNVLRQEEWSAPWTSLVAIQPGGSRPPFFCIHGHDGHVFYFRDLARLLGPEQPFYGLQALGLDGKQARHTRVEEMAAHYLKELQTLQPEGPYFLGGYCFGGRVAFEMAQQLCAQGQTVALLALLNAFAPGHPQPLPHTTVFGRVAQMINHYWRDLKRLQPEERLPYIRVKRRSTQSYLKMIARKYVRAIGGLLLPPLRQSHETNHYRLQDYVGNVYPGKMTLFRASIQPIRYYRDPQMGWGGLAAGGLEIYEVPSYDGSIVQEPCVRVLAERLKACLHMV